MHSARTTLVPDRELGVEAYLFQGFIRPFARHFHAHYVFGLIEDGSRTLQCAGRVWHLCRDHVLLINPGENHGCEAGREGAITYLSLSVPIPTMEHWTRAAALDALPSLRPAPWTTRIWPAACACCTPPSSRPSRPCAARSCWATCCSQP